MNNNVNKVEYNRRLNRVGIQQCVFIGNPKVGDTVYYIHDEEGYPEGLSKDEWEVSKFAHRMLAEEKEGKIFWNCT